MPTELQRLLKELGATEDELDTSDPEVATRIWRRIYGLNGRPITLEEAARRSGMDSELADRLQRAAGLPRDLVEEDVALLEGFAAMARLTGDEQALHLARVTSAAMAKVAEAGAAAVRVQWETPLLREVTYAEYLRGANDVIADLFPRLSTIFDRVFRHQLMRTSEQTWSIDPAGTATTTWLTVGFADVVGFTARAASSTTGDLARAIDEFEDRVTEVISKAGGRIVKFIGDEVMFVFEQTDAACRAALALRERSIADLIPEVRVGLARGPVLMRLGDYFGPVVNVASRLVGIAPPNGIFVSPEVAGDAPDLDFTQEEPRAVKGIAEPLSFLRLVPPPTPN